uniref:Uncharacterized protein n=1 Tax=Sphaeramia orbicularis TaxID=375764 RepID=A0A673CS44_9TELE
MGSVTKETQKCKYYLRKQLNPLMNHLMLFQCVIDHISAVCG